MPPTKPERPPSRPPLTTRIRNSFESKRRLSSELKRGLPSSDGTKPSLNAQTTYSEGRITQYPEALRDAVDKAINSEAFQAAMAANLARLIKPSIRDALDTLQPVVEAVYGHEILLRKMNNSVENILVRMDSTVDGDTAGLTVGGDEESTPARYDASSWPLTDKAVEPPAVAGQTRQDVGSNNAQIEAKLSELSSVLKAHSGRLAEVADGIGGIRTALQPTREGVVTIQPSTEQSNTSLSNIQTQLDGLKADIGDIKNAVGSGLGEHVASHDPSILSSHTTKLDAITTEVAALKGHSDSMDKLSAISATLEALKENLNTGITLSDDHFAALTLQITTILTSVEGHATSLTDLKAANASSVILAAVNKANDSHEAHAAALGEIKERSLAPASDKGSDSTAALEALAADLASLKLNIQAGLTSNNDNLTAVGSKVDNVLTTLEAHRAADHSPAILEAVNKLNDSHAAHAEALEGIKSVNTVVAPVANPSNFEPHLATILGTLEAHTASHAANSAALESRAAALENVKLLNADATPAAVLKPQLATIISTLESHSAAHASQTAAQEVHAAALEGVRSLYADTARSDENSASLEPQLATIINTLQSHTNSHTSHTAALESIRSLKSEATPIASSPDLEPKLDAIISTLASHADSHATHATALQNAKSLKTDPESQADLQPQLASIISTLECHTAGLEELKSTSASRANSILGPHMKSIVDILESHTNLLNEIKDDISAEILSTLHDIKDSHASHQIVLNEIQDADVSDEILTALHSSNDSHTNHAAVLAGIHHAVKASMASHAAHASALDDVKAPSSVETIATDATGAVDFGPILSTLADHTSTLAAIKEAATASNDSHEAHAASLDEIKGSVNSSRDLQGSHAASLDKIKGFNTSHASSLAELKAVSSTEPAKIDFSTLEAHLTTITNTLKAQNTTFSEIKDATTRPEVLEAVKDLHEITHTTLLNTIQAASTHEDILTNIGSLKSMLEDSKSGIDAHGASIKDLHDSTQSSHSDITSAIVGLAVGGAAGGLLANHSHDSKEVLEEIKAVKEIVEKSAAQVDVNHYTITTLSEQLKTEIRTSGMEIKTIIAELGEGVDTRATSAGFESHRTEVPDSGGEAHGLTGYVLHTHENGHVLEEGVHFDEREVGQFQECGAENEPEAPTLQAVREDISAQALRSALESQRQEVRDCDEKAGCLTEHIPSVVENVETVQEGEHAAEKEVGQSNEHVVGSAPLAAGLVTGALAAGGLGLAAIHEEGSEEKQPEASVTAVEDIKKDTPEAESQSPLEEVSAAEEVELEKQGQSIDSEPLVENAPAPETETAVDAEPGADRPTDESSSVVDAESQPALEEISNTQVEAVKEIEPEHETHTIPESKTVEPFEESSPAHEAEEPSIQSEPPFESKQESEPLPEAMPTLETEALKDNEPELESQSGVKRELSSEPVSEEAPNVESESSKEIQSEVGNDPVDNNEQPSVKSELVEEAAPIVSENKYETSSDLTLEETEAVAVEKSGSIGGHEASPEDESFVNPERAIVSEVVQGPLPLEHEAEQGSKPEPASNELPTEEPVERSEPSPAMEAAPKSQAVGDPLPASGRETIGDDSSAEHEIVAEKALELGLPGHEPPSLATTVEEPSPPESEKEKKADVAPTSDDLPSELEAREEPSEENVSHVPSKGGPISEVASSQDEVPALESPSHEHSHPTEEPTSDENVAHDIGVPRQGDSTPEHEGPPAVSDPIHVQRFDDSAVSNEAAHDNDEELSPAIADKSIHTPHLTTNLKEEDTVSHEDFSPIDNYELFSEGSQPLNICHTHATASSSRESQDSSAFITSPTHAETFSLEHVSDDDHQNDPHEPALSMDFSNRAGEMETPSAWPASEYDEQSAATPTLASPPPLSSPFSESPSVKKVRRGKKKGKVPFVFDPEDEEDPKEE